MAKRHFTKGTLFRLRIFGGSDTKCILRYAVLLAAVFNIAMPVLGMPPLLTGYTRRLWRAQDGLPDQAVQAIAQTPDGYLWVGTKGGLLRFDGARFVVYDHTNTPGLSESNVNCLSVSRDGSLWIGTEGGGLVRYRDQVFQTYPMADGSSDSFIRVIFEDHRGVIWVGGDQGLFQVNGAALTRIDGLGQIPSIFVRAIVEDRENHVWVGGTTLLRFDGKAVKEYPLPGGPSFNLVTAMLAARDGVFWVGTLSGLHTLLPSGALRKIDGVPGAIQTLRETSDSSVWIGTPGGGGFIERNGILSALSAPDFLPSNTVLSIFEDGEHNLWLGTQAGMLRLSRSPVAVIPFPEASDSQFETIYQDRDGSVWAASTHLFHIRNGEIARATFPAIPNVRVRTLLRDRKGDWWIGTGGTGLYHLMGGRVVHYISPVLANDFIRVILQARDGSLWVGTDGGLSHIAPARITNYNTPNGLSYFSVTALLEDHLGDIWIGTSRGISHLHRGAFVHDNVTALLKHEKIWSIHEDPENGLWFGTSNGLYYLNDGIVAICTTAQGLAGNIIYQILEDHSSHLWLSGPNDISQVDRHAVESVLKPGAHPRISLTLYPISQDFDSAELYGGMQPAGFISQQNEVWFPSNKGPVHSQIPRGPPQPHSSFPVVIDSVLANGRELPIRSPVVVAPGDGRLEISFAAILLRSQEGLRYRYVLEGFDHDWNEVSTRRTAYYTNLPPGKYRFRVQAYEISNPSAVSEATIKVAQQPHFYRTLWFYVLCLSVLLAAALAIHRYRLRQVSMRFHAVLEERNRMAREMHDTVIQDCVGLSTLLEAVSSLDFSDKALSHQLVDHAREQVVTTIDEARVAVWNLRHGEVQSENIGEIVRQMTEQMHGKLGQPIACSVLGNAFPLSQRAAHEIVMIVREAIWNAHTHAYSTHIGVRVAFTEKDLAIDVQDDGVGFDSATMPGKSELHYGLIGMRERAQRLGGELRIETCAGKGTTIKILLPRTMREARHAEQTVDHA